jgi:CelD/BcsL family acetyltransferase involved in cellulose biosynthesis
MKTHMRTAIHNAFKAGWLQLAFLTVGGKKAASYLNFDFQNRLYIYNSGLNPIFENLSPGWVLLGYLIEWAIAEGREMVDFMRGDEGYKYQLGGKDRFVIRATLTRQA